ncbi:MAG TPA: hypothetical protein VMU16_01485 [Candidatus Binataceae bacterium]|nr:hypothetical protein [Candidatus Binataceae bacterium]
MIIRRSIFLLAAGFALTAVASFGLANAAAPALQVFSTMAAKAEVQPHAVEVSAAFTIGPKSSGVDFIKDTVVLRVDKSQFVISPNSFKMTQSGWFKYEGVINGLDAEIRVVPLGDNRYQMRASLSGKDFKQPGPGPLKVQVSIGLNSGVALAVPREGWL